MSSVLDSLRSLATQMAGALPCAADLGGLSTSDEVEAVRLLGGVRAAVSESIAHLAADIERKSARQLGTDGLAQQNGFTDGAGLVQSLVGVERAEAAKLIRVGGMLETAAAAEPEPASAAEPVEPPVRSIDFLAAVAGGWDAPIGVALRHGWLTAAHADGLRRGLGAPRGETFTAVWRTAVLNLIGDCWSGRWNPDDLGRAAKRMKASLDTAAASAEAAQRYEQRSMRRFVRRSGMVHYDLDLDPESDARFYGPIKQILSPRFGGPRFTAEADIAAARELEEDPRTNAQLQADTLVDLIQRAVNTDPGDLFKTHEPQVTIAVTTGELRKARTAQEALHRHHAGDHAGCPGGDMATAAAGRGGAGATGDGIPVAGLAGTAFRAACPGPGPDQGVAFLDGRDEPITATDALRMICDRGFTPLLFDETGQTIDLGKDQRYFTRRQRRAIAQRDGRCRYPGCDKPPEDCEYHHVNPWAEKLSNRKSETRDGVLLCRRHHKLTHDHGARVERRRGDYWLHWPGTPPVLLHPKSGIRTLIRQQA